MSTLTTNEIRSTIWYAMGVTEGAAIPFDITVAANGGYGGSAIQSSGYSLGMLQFDFGQRGTKLPPGGSDTYSKMLFDDKLLELSYG